jgi:hypothetical protein
MVAQAVDMEIYIAWNQIIPLEIDTFGRRKTFEVDAGGYPDNPSILDRNTVVV